MKITAFIVIATLGISWTAFSWAAVSQAVTKKPPIKSWAERKKNKNQKDFDPTMGKRPPQNPRFTHQHPAFPACNKKLPQVL